MKPSSHKLISGAPSRRGKRGVALVITLLMLSIITFMAVTFLVLSQRERSSVNGDTDSRIARNASDAAFARVSSELLTHMLLHSNFQDFDLLVSTNYINYNGFIDGLPPNPQNVNYDHETNKLTFTGGAVEWERNIANLLFNPRAPVFVVTNKGTGASEFRYYLDLNRNGRFDANGLWPVVVLNPFNGLPNYLTTNSAGAYVPVATNSGGWVLSNSMVGDPEWIGVLERPNELHSADNGFIARYAYLVVPVGKTLDVNYMHNETMTKNPSPTAFGADGFFRNQGVGPWEENLAAFLVDLNTNEWFANPNIPQTYYQYNEGNWFGLGLNKGLAFDDARAILSYRYANNYSTLFPASAWFPGGAASLANDGIDQYSDGPLMAGTITNETGGQQDSVGTPWAGSDNTNHYFSAQDLFDRTKTQVGISFPTLGFSDRLQNAGTSNDTYNAYTYYRLLSQLGTDSAGDQGKININYKNTDLNGHFIAGSETNLNGWTPLDFFTNAANAMFAQANMRDFNGNLITTTNIPLFETNAFGVSVNYYTPAVQRILQLAANIYDATTNRFIGAGPTNYPSVFRPIFRSQDGVVYICGYTEVIDYNDAFNPYVDMETFVTVDNPPRSNINMYGVPWIIGAKKGFPNFNEFSMVNPVNVSRKIQFTNTTGAAGPPYTTNQLWDFSITNSFGVEAWNSYTNAYGRPLRLIVTNELSINLTNQFGFSLLNVTNLPYGADTNIFPWPGWTMGGARKDITSSDGSFQVPLYVSTIYTNGIYSPSFVFPLTPPRWTLTFQPRLWLNLRFKIRFMLIDTTANRLVDFVNLESIQPPVDITTILDNGDNGQEDPKNNPSAQWDTNFLNGTSGISQGLYNQFEAGLGAYTPGDWNDTPQNISAAQALFRKRLNNAVTNNFQDPYSPYATIFQRISWQANDPLVHYTSSDLTSSNNTAETPYNGVYLNDPIYPPLPNLGALNFAYQPWGGYHLPPRGSAQNTSQFDFDWRVKDSMMQQSDDWDFPTNKLPNIGWLGRIHRGTPWQTIYMKPANIGLNDWRTWDNDNQIITNGTVATIDAAFTHPTNDYGLFDLFTTAVNDNASRGRLDVNQTNLAAWSAILSGVNVLTNDLNGDVGPFAIPPAGVYDPANPTGVAAIVAGINATRANTNAALNSVFLNNTFQHAGDVLATPQLSVASPFLTNTVPYNPTNRASGPQDLTANGVSDEVMERIPQQIMSLLTLNQSPRFVIYSFGQTLHPADHSRVIGGAFNGLCTNYQVTAETATRAVVRVEGTPDPFYVNGKLDPQGRSYPPHIVVEQFNVLGPN